MFSKSRINEPGTYAAGDDKSKSGEAAKAQVPEYTPSTPKAKPPASTLSSDLVITGNIKTTADIQIEGTVEGDIYAHMLTVGGRCHSQGRVRGRRCGGEWPRHWTGARNKSAPDIQRAG